ncbi:hypothetical protein QFZ37_000727 [Chryseobacterium ginsenosidimutans]|uniref:terpene synthase family protein n=1 Tax=Chryseobacterium ginsenosidimutans TaxID=687846 RepID=UPI002789F442|nr:hypothetical protein [Chryseobacterium ginsenosidimutans]MDQ0592358.1 hypothetical protein [Chryseobacterium ginsenosidimutans]
MKSQIFSLDYPFELKVSPYVESIEQKVTLWIDDYTCIQESLRKRYKKSNFGKFTASFFPFADSDMLIIMSRWILAAFAFDDLYGSYPLDELKKQCQKVIDIFKGNSSYADENEIFKQFTIVRDDLLPLVTQEWMERFIYDHQFWFDGMFEETHYSYKETTIYPTFEQYVSIREKVSGGGTLCDFLEICSDFIMPKEVFSHPTIQRIRQLLAFMMSWFNDIHSVPWELERNEAMNLVLVIKNERDCTFEEAYEEAIKIHNNDLAEFIKIRQNLPDFGMYNAAVERFVHNAELFLKGQESWYFGGTERYNPEA